MIEVKIDFFFYFLQKNFMPNTEIKELHKLTIIKMGEEL